MDSEDDGRGLAHFAGLMYDADDPREALLLYMKGADRTGQFLKVEIETLLNKVQEPIGLARAIGQYGDYGDRLISAMITNPPDYRSYLEETLRLIAAANTKSQ